MWRSVVISCYVGWALLCSFAMGGGLVVLTFFGVWAGVWILFSAFWRWADNERRLVLRRRGYY